MLAFWRHVVKRYPLTYDHGFWGAVFPLGMYAACTAQMVAAMAFDFLAFVPKVFLAIALVAWTAAFIGFVRDLARRLRGYAAA